MTPPPLPLIRRQSASMLPFQGPILCSDIPLDPAQNWTYINRTLDEISDIFTKNEIESSPARIAEALLNQSSSCHAYAEYIAKHSAEIDARANCSSGFTKIHPAMY